MRKGGSVYDSCSAISTVIVDMPSVDYLRAASPGPVAPETPEVHPIK